MSLWAWASQRLPGQAAQQLAQAPNQNVAQGVATPYPYQQAANQLAAAQQQAGQNAAYGQMPPETFNNWVPDDELSYMGLLSKSSPFVSVFRSRGNISHRLEFCQRMMFL